MISWTAWQTPLYNKQEKKEDLATLLKSKTRAELATEQGWLAALTPLRDVLEQGDTWILLLGASALIFKFSADRWGRFDDPTRSRRDAATGWTTLCWVGTGLYVMYRLASMIYDPDPLQPLGGCLFPEIVAVPLFMALADAVILSWQLVELRAASSEDEAEGFDVAGTVNLVPAAIVACLLAMPARYVATAVGLAFFYHLPAGLMAHPVITILMKGWGLIQLQAFALPLAGLVGAVAWSHGSIFTSFRTFGKLLRHEGGRLLAVLALCGAAGGGLAFLAYMAVLALPPQPWILGAADSYAHYATLPVGMITLSALVGLASRYKPEPRPTAKPAPVEEVVLHIEQA